METAMVTLIEMISGIELSVFQGISRSSKQLAFNLEHITRTLS